MVTRKKEDDEKDIEVKVEDRKPERHRSTLAGDAGDPSIVQPKPGGPTPNAGVGLGHNR